MSVEDQEVAPQADRRDMLAEQLDAIETPEAVESSPDPVEAKSDRARDEAGKFVAKAPEASNEAAAAPVEPAAPVEEPVWKRPPNSWKRDYHDVWASADPRLQEYAYQREEQMRAGVEPLKTKAEVADRFNQTIEPYMNTIRGMNIDPMQAVAGLMNTDHTLRNGSQEQKQQEFLKLAHYYGIDLNGAAVQQQPVAAPEYYAVQNEITQLRGQLNSFQQAQQAAEENQILAEINKFAPNKEFFEDARPLMVDLLQKGLAVDLEDAYEKAVRLDDTLFNTVQSRRQAQTTSAKVAVADKAAKAAKAAAVSVKSSTPGAATTTKAQDRRSRLAEQFEGLDERF